MKNNLEKLRKESGISQEELAQVLEVSRHLKSQIFLRNQLKKSLFMKENEG